MKKHNPYFIYNLHLTYGSLYYELILKVKYTGSQTVFSKLSTISYSSIKETSAKGFLVFRQPFGNPESIEAHLNISENPKKHFTILQIVHNPKGADEIGKLVEFLCKITKCDYIFMECIEQGIIFNKSLIHFYFTYKYFSIIGIQHNHV